MLAYCFVGCRFFWSVHRCGLLGFVWWEAAQWVSGRTSLLWGLFNVSCQGEGESLRTAVSQSFATPPKMSKLCIFAVLLILQTIGECNFVLFYFLSVKRKTLWKNSNKWSPVYLRNPSSNFSMQSGWSALSESSLPGSNADQQRAFLSATGWKLHADDQGAFHGVPNPVSGKWNKPMGSHSSRRAGLCRFLSSCIQSRLSKHAFL